MEERKEVMVAIRVWEEEEEEVVLSAVVELESSERVEGVRRET